jgi:hypothetical protein
MSLYLKKRNNGEKTVYQYGSFEPTLDPSYISLDSPFKPAYAAVVCQPMQAPCRGRPPERQLPKSRAKKVAFSERLEFLPQQGGQRIRRVPACQVSPFSVRIFFFSFFCLNSISLRHGRIFVL